jgi:hypothetical protein
MASATMAPGATSADPIRPGRPGALFVRAQPEPSRRPLGDPPRARSAARRRGEERAHPSRGLAVDPAFAAKRGRRGDRRVAGGGDARIQDLGEQHAERPQVRGGARLAMVAELGRGVAGRPAEGRRAEAGREAEVNERRPALVGGVAERPRRREEHVVGLHVAVPHAGLMKLLERAADRVRDHGRQLSPLRRPAVELGGLEAPPRHPRGRHEPRACVEERRPPPPLDPRQEPRLPRQRVSRGKPILGPLERGQRLERAVSRPPDHRRGALAHALQELPPRGRRGVLRRQLA